MTSLLFFIFQLKGMKSNSGFPLISVQLYSGLVVPIQLGNFTPSGISILPPIPAIVYLLPVFTIVGFDCISSQL